MSLAPPSELNGVKVYNLASVGKALPAWVTAKKKAVEKVKKKKWNDPGSSERLEVLQDLFFPTSSGRIKVSRDGGTLMATGMYPPQVRCYELRELSLKFSRHFEAEVVQFQILSPDWKKAAFLLADRSIEFHSQFGKHHVTRIPTHGRAMGYQRETCELLVGGAGEEVYRLSLERGSFLAPLKTGSEGVNAIAVHPGHGMLAVGTMDGFVQCWDPRARAPLGVTSPYDDAQIANAAAGIAPAAPAATDANGDEPSLAPWMNASAALRAQREVTALRFDDRGLTLAVGTSTGHVALYDIRKSQPLLVKDHFNALPIIDIKYHQPPAGGSEYLVSADCKSVKIWDKEHGKTYTTIQPPANVNDVAIFPGSGMMFAALETERLGAYFLPSLGPAPRWCHFLDGMTEEMEEAPASHSMYDDYKVRTAPRAESRRLLSPTVLCSDQCAHMIVRVCSCVCACARACACVLVRVLVLVCPCARACSLSPAKTSRSSPSPRSSARAPCGRTCTASSSTRGCMPRPSRSLSRSPTSSGGRRGSRRRLPPRPRDASRPWSSPRSR